MEISLIKRYCNYRQHTDYSCLCFYASVLERFAKKREKVKVTIYTDPKAKLSEQDIQKFNEQYPQLILKHSTKVHDRFLIIDNATLYHIGASLKDLGKKCFAFEVLDQSWVKEILKNL